MGKPVATTPSRASDLKRLQQVVKQAGQISKRANSKKKNTRSGPGSDKNKTRDAISAIPNPFELRFAKNKFNVLGRKIQGQLGRPGESRSKAYESRKQKLLPEIKKGNKVGTFVDRRFGENNLEMTEEDKMVQRFTKERQQKFARKANLYNLEAGDHLDGENLTHGGQSLATLDDFSEFIPLDSDNEGAGEIDADIVADEHFGGFMTRKDEDRNLEEFDISEDEQTSDTEHKKRSYKEVMEEVIAKSKFYKQQRQQTTIQNDQLTQALDAGFLDLRSALLAKDAVDRSKPNAGSLIYQTEQKATLPLPTEFDDYDSYVVELAQEKRSRPQDRLKTEEELLANEKEKLEQLEKERLLRMKGITSTASDNTDESHPTRNRHASGDALEDDGTMSYSKKRAAMNSLSYKNGKLIRRSESSDEEEEEGESEDGEEDEDEGEYEEEEEEDDESRSDSEIDENDQPDSNEYKENHQTKERGKVSSTHSIKQNNDFNLDDSLEIPFLFPIPQDKHQLNKWLSGKSREDQQTILDRILLCHHVKLSATHRGELSIFLDILFDDIQYFCQERKGKDSILLEDIEVLVKTLYRLATEQIPQYFAESCLNRIIEFQERLAKQLQSGNTKSFCFPTAFEMILFQLIGYIYAVSDFRHKIVTPTVLLMNQYLSQCPLTCHRDVIVGLYLCQMMLSYFSESKKYSPEICHFLIKVLNYLAGNETPSVLFMHRMETQNIIHSLRYDATVEADTISLSDALTNHDMQVSTKSLLCFTLQVLQLLIETTKDAVVFPELFSEMNKILVILLGEAKKDKKNKADLKKVLKLIEEYTMRQNTTREPLQWQRFKPVALSGYLPKFDEQYSLDRKQGTDLNRQRVQGARLRAVYNRELKDTVRELRKDAQFLAGVKIDKQIQQDKVYKAKIKKIEGILSAEQGEANQEMRMKKRSPRVEKTKDAASVEETNE